MSTSTQGGRKEAHAVLLKHSHNVRKRDESDFPIYGAQVPYSECVNAMEEYAAIRAVAFAEWSMTHDIVEGSTPEQMYRQFLQDTK